MTADLILKTNYSTLSMASNFLMGDIRLSLSVYNVDEKITIKEDLHSTIRDAITRKLFDDLLYSTRKEERCAGAVWLLSITMYCGQHPSVHQMLPEIQVYHLLQKNGYIFSSYNFSPPFPPFYVLRVNFINGPLFLSENRWPYNVRNPHD